MSVSTSSVRFKNFLNATADQIHSRYEVETVLNDIVQTVELYNNQSDLYTLKKNYGVSKSLSLKLLRTIDVLDNENRNIRSELNVIKKKSSIVREKFALQISSILKESKQLSTHKSTITSLERRLADMEREYTIAKDKVSMQETVSSIVDFSNHLTGQIQSLSSSKSVEPSSEEATTNVTIASPISTPSHPSLESLAITNTSIEIQQENSFPLPDPSTTSVVPIAVAQAPVSKPTVYIVKTLLSLEDQVFLNTFSFLTTVEVLNFAQSCRMLFRRVNQLFGMESQVHMDTWTLDFERYSTHPNEASSSSEGPESRISSESTDKSMPESQISTATKSDLTLSQSIASSIFSSPLIKMATGGKLGVFPSTQSAQPSPTPAAVVTTVSKSTNINGTSGSSSSASAASTTTSTNIDGSEVSINSNGSATNGSSSQSGSVTTTSGVQPGGLSREMAEQFAKKLNAAELTAIKALSDLLRKQTGQMTTLREEKELVETKLQVSIYCSFLAHQNTID